MERDNGALTARVMAAKSDGGAFDALARDYAPFLRAAVAKTVRDSAKAGEDELASVALLAFYEAVRAYDPARGGFISYARLLIEKRLFDEFRRARKAPGLVEQQRGASALGAAGLDSYLAQQQQLALAEELAQLERDLGARGVTLDGVYRDAPKHRETRRRLDGLIARMPHTPELIHCMLHKNYVPIAGLVRLAEQIAAERGEPALSRKAIERRRRYLLACALVHGGDYVYLRNYL